MSNWGSLISFHVKRIIFVFFVLGLFVLFSPCLNGQILVERGDVSGDGRIDGRDALLLLRSIAGLETLTDDQKDQGDVYPNPGTGDRPIGDGQLTEDDVRQILRYSVRLIPEAELNGNLYASAPVIHQFDPKFGNPGTRVLIEGGNFIRTAPDLNIVEVGGVPVPVLEVTSSSLLIEISSDMESGIIEIITPGGEASSLDSFTVTKTVQGVIETGDGINLSDLTIVNRFDETSDIDAEGNFDVTVAQDSVSLVGAVPAGDSKNTYFAFLFPEIEVDEQTGKVRTRQVADSLEINALSTAKALIFLHPFFATNNVYAARWVMDKLDTVPEVQEFARTIANRYPQGADGLNDDQVGTAWEEAIYAILTELPDSMVLHLGSPPAKIQSQSMNRPWSIPLSSPFSLPDHNTEKFNQPAQSSSNLTTIKRADMDFVDLGNISNEDAVQVQYRVQNDYNPLEWIVTFYPVDYTDMPDGLKNPFLTARRGIRRTETWANDTLVFLPSNLWASNISPSQAIDVIVDAPIVALSSILGVEEPLERLIPINDSFMGVYECRAYSGALGNNDPRDHEIIQSIDNGPNYAMMALILNISAGMLDVLGDLLGDDVTSIIDESVHESILSLNAQGLRIYPLPQDEEQQVQIIFTIIRVIAEKIVENALAMPSVSDAIKEEIASLLIPYSRVLGTLETISTIGKVAERTAALMGYLINVFGLELSPAGPTPLESCFVQIGDPFSPSITRITPSEGPVNSQVRIFGNNFQLDPGDNTVRFGNYSARIVEIINRGEMVVEAPSFLTKHQDYSVRLETTAASSGATASERFYVTAQPIISRLEPNWGYSKPTDPDNPFYDEDSTLVSIEGMNFQEDADEEPYEVFFDWRQTDTIGRYDHLMYSYVHEGLRGDVPVHVLNPNTGERSNELTFHIFDQPEISRLSAERAKEGQRFEIAGDNLLNAKVMIGDYFATVYQTFVNRIIVEMNGSGEENEPVPITIWTPSGSARTQIIREPGLERPDYERLPSGSGITVTDYTNGIVKNGHLSLAEAVMFAKGEANPFLDGWDDDNELHEEIWENERRVRYDDDHNPIYYYVEVKVGDRSSRSPGGVGLEYRVYEKVLRDEQGNEISRTNIRTESKDATDDDREEGDRFSGIPSAEKRERISIQGEHAIRSPGFELGPQDEIEIDRKSSLQVTGAIKIPMGLMKTGSIQMEGSIELGNSSSISAATVENAQILLQDAIGAKVTVDTILNSPGHAIDIKNGGLNEISVEKIQDANGDGVRITSSQQNNINIYNSISKCSGNGVTLEDIQAITLRLSIDSCQNGIYGTNSENITLSSIDDEHGIRNCRENGIDLTGGGFHKFENIHVMNNGGEGIHIVNGDGNVFESVIVEGNKKNGFLMEDESGGNRFTSVHVRNNDKNGIVLSGEGNAQNIFEWMEVEGNGSPMGNGHGLVLMNGASHNSINGFIASLNKGHAILISGPNTTGNRITDMDYKKDFDLDFVNTMTGDGIHIENGASETVIRDSEISTVNNGIYIDGGVETIIEECWIGRVYNEDDDIAWYNKGRGIIITNNAVGTYINSCTLGYNAEGGVLIRNLDSSDYSEENISILMRNCKIGTNLQKSEVRLTKRTKTGGSAIECENVKYAEFDTIFTFLHEDGIKIVGNNESLRFDNTYVYFPEGKGLYVTNTDGFHIELFTVNGAGDDGIHLSNIENAEFLSELLPLYNFWNNSTGGNDGYGLYMEDCKNISVTNAYISRNGKDGVRAVNCDTVNFKDFWVSESDQNGFVLNGCKNFVFDMFEIVKSLAWGIWMENSKNVELIGESRSLNFKWGFQMNQNEEGCIKIDNCQDIIMGENGLGGSLSGGGTSLWITGDQTRNVQVINCNIHRSENEAACLIQGGQDITIGSNNDKWGNYIEMNDNAGVLVQGENTRVRILGNAIGVPARYEKDPMASWGNQDGVVLEQGAKHNLIQGNLFLLNKRHGIYIRDGANTNSITRNRIKSNGENGIHVEGAASRFNHISQNSIYNNDGAGIRLNGGNDMVESPIITKVERQQRQVFGKVNQDAPDGSIVEVFADMDDEGEILIGLGMLFGKKFICQGFVPKGMKYHATITHPDGNTSEFGPTVIDIKTDPFLFSETSGGNTDLYLYNDTLKRPARITNDPAKDYDPSLSEDQNNVLFVSSRSGNPDIWHLTLDSFDLTSLTNNTAPDYDPVWMADGDHFLFVSDRDGNPEIYMQAVSESGGGEGGDSIVLSYFSGGDDPNAEIYARSDTMGNGLGTQFNYGPELLTEFQVYISADPAPIRWKIFPYANWQAKPDEILAEGEENITETGWHTISVGELQVPEQYIVMIYFEEDYKPQLGIASAGEEGHTWMHRYFENFDQWNLSKSFAQYVMMKAIAVDPAPAGPTRLTNDPGIDRYPAISPDGNTVAFTSTRAGNEDIWLMNTDGSNLINLTQGNGNSRQPSWSPQGSKIGFVSDRDGNPEIYMMNVDGGDAVRLTQNEADDTDPGWSQSGDRILYSTNRLGNYEINSLNVYNPVPHRVTIGTLDARYPETGAFEAQSLENRIPNKPMLTKTTQTMSVLEPLTVGEIALQMMDAEAKPGSVAEILLQLIGAQSLGNLDLEIAYNPVILSLVESPSLEFQTEHSLYEINPPDYPAHLTPVRLNWIGAEGLTSDLSEIRLNFMINEKTIHPDTVVSINNAEAYSVNLTPVSVIAKDAVITISGNETSVNSWMLY